MSIQQNLTLGAVDCIHPNLALKALIKSQDELLRKNWGPGVIQTPPKAKLFTHKNIGVPQDIELVEIEELKSGEEVSRWMLADYCKHIDTPFLLNIQADGFVTNGKAWTDEFLEYDYIGAPWGLHPLHEWPPFPNVTESNRIGNGGFSLRSTDLMVQVAMLFDDSLDPSAYHPEDCWICRTNGSLLRNLGLRFAPHDVARRFSVENARIDEHFGFHGKLTMRLNPRKTRL